MPKDETVIMLPTITLEDRVRDMQIDLKHMKSKLDLVVFFLQKMDKNGLKVKVIK